MPVTTRPTAVAELQASGTDPFVAPEKTRHGHKPPPAPRGRIPKELSPRDRMRGKLQTKGAVSRQKSPTPHPCRWVVAGATFHQRHGVIIIRDTA